MRTLTPRPLAAVAVAATVLVLAACGSDSDGGSGDPAATTITVTATDTTCELSATSAPVGPVTFTVTNEGTEVTEFYLYDGDAVVAEVENIAPGLTRDMAADLSEAGTLTTACKPGMTGEGIRADFTVGDATT